MKKSIENLKAIITDRMTLKRGSAEPIIIRRYPNNIIKIHNKSVSWKVLQDLLINGEYDLQIKESQVNLFDRDEKKWGGYRIARPGKKLGRKPVKDKKVPVTLSIRQSIKQKMLEILESQGIDKNQFFENCLNQAYDTITGENV